MYDASMTANVPAALHVTFEFTWRVADKGAHLGRPRRRYPAAEHLAFRLCLNSAGVPPETRPVVGPEPPTEKTVDE